jgi:hypothetical protein
MIHILTSFLPLSSTSINFVNLFVQLAMSPASPKLSFKTNRDRSVSSLLSIGVTHRTPKVARRGNGVTEEKTVTIRCQRLTADKRYEEVDVEVPGKTH